jgi:hypothetical protein
VLDDVQRCFADPAVAPLLDELRALANRRAVRLLLIGRERVPWVTCPPLDGLPASEALALWESIGGPALQLDRWDEVLQATAGLPGLLRLVAHYADEYGLRGSWHDELEGWSRVELWDRLDDDDQRVLSLLVADSRPLPPDNAALLAAVDVTAARLAALEERGVLLRVAYGLVPHPVLRLAAPPISVPHWEQLQIAHSEAVRPTDSAAEGGNESCWQPVEVTPPPAEVVVPAELVARAAELIERLGSGVRAEVNPMQLRVVAEQLRAHLPAANHERAFNR